MVRKGRLSQVAGHDLTYMADTGLLSLGPTHDGVPALPPVLVGDIGAGSLPAVVNILLALRQRDRTGEGCWLDVSITDNLLAFSVFRAGTRCFSRRVAGARQGTSDGWDAALPNLSNE